MFLAPRLPREVTRRGRLFRVLSGAGLGAAALLLLVTNSVLYFACYYLVQPTVSPQELYDRTWLAVRDNIYDQEKLKGWDSWRHKFDAEIRTDEDAYRYAQQMLAALGYPYTFLESPPQVKSHIDRAGGQYIGIGITFGERLDAHGNALPGRSQEGFPVVSVVIRGSPADKAGLKSGDLLTAIDGQPTDGVDFENLAGALKGDAGTAVELTVVRDGQELKIAIVRGLVNVPIVSTRRLPAGIGYLRIEAFDQWDTADEVEQALEDLSDCKALVVDIRDNPGGFIHTAVKASAFFLKEGKITTERSRIPGGGYMTNTYAVTPGAFVWELTIEPLPKVSIKWPARPANLSGDRPVVLLVNDGTASAAELFAGALSDNGRVTVIGTPTFGKGIGQTLVPVGNGYRLRITSIKGYTPNGTFIGYGDGTGSGIKPDIELKAPWGLIFGRADDNQLNAAVEHLKRRLSAP